jgi:FkbM family methyltransferase
MEHEVIDLSDVPAEFVQRVRTTVSCLDCDDIEKVAGAGQIREQDGTRVQLMHNGVVVEAGGYHGDWMSEIIRVLHGHHEPQEELVFHRIIERLRRDAEVGSVPTMIEFGSFWSYYTLWFCVAFPRGRAVALEPDPNNLALGRRNAALNGVSERITFVHAAIGDPPGQSIMMATESDGQERETPTHDLASLMAATQLDHVDLILCDVQGAETILLRRAAADFEAGRVRFMLVSTHHHAISGDPLTHQSALTLLRAAGAHVIAEHTANESFSGDGLIAVSFDERDRDLVVAISHSRAVDSLFGELEPDLAAARVASAQAQQLVAVHQQTVDDQQQRIAELESELAQARGQIERMASTRIWRFTERPRQLYARVRR